QCSLPARSALAPLNPSRSPETEVPSGLRQVRSASGRSGDVLGTAIARCESKITTPPRRTGANVDDCLVVCGQFTLLAVHSHAAPVAPVGPDGAMFVEAFMGRKTPFCYLIDNTMQFWI